MNFNNVNVSVSGSQSIIKALQNYNTITLKPNIIDNRNVLTQEMISEKHTKYVIKWNYSLEDAIINIPKDCILEFAGGTINNGIIVGNNTIIISAQSVDNIFNNITKTGTFIYNNFRADEDDLSIDEDKLKFKDKEITPYRETPIFYLKGKVLEDGTIEIGNYNTSTDKTRFAQEGIYILDRDYVAKGQVLCNKTIDLLFVGGNIHNTISNRYLIPETFNARIIEEVGEKDVILKTLKSDGTYRIYDYVSPIFARGRVKCLSDGLCEWMTNLPCNNYINVVEMFGIDNTGMKDVTDDLNAIFAKFNNMPNMNGVSALRNEVRFARDEGLVFYFPRGIYRVSGPLVPYRRITIIGEYHLKRAENYSCAGTTFLFLPRQDGEQVLFSNNGDYIFGLKNISVVCDSYSVKVTTSSTGINTHRYKLTDHTPNRQCVAAITNYVNDCHFQGFNKCALKCLQFSNFLNVVITNCYVGISTESEANRGYTGDLYLTNSWIRQCYIGCKFDSGQWNVIRNSLIEEMPGYGIYADTTSVIEMVGVHMNHIYYNAVRINSDVRLMISGCVLNRCGMADELIGRKGDAYTWINGDDNKKNDATIYAYSITNSNINFTQSNAILGDHTDQTKLPDGKTPENYRCLPVPITVWGEIHKCNICISELYDGQTTKGGTRLVVVSFTGSEESTDNYILDNGANHIVLDDEYRG